MKNTSTPAAVVIILACLLGMSLVTGQNTQLSELAKERAQAYFPSASRFYVYELARTAATDGKVFDAFIKTHVGEHVDWWARVEFSMEEVKAYQVIPIETLVDKRYMHSVWVAPKNFDRTVKKDDWIHFTGRIRDINRLDTKIEDATVVEVLPPPTLLAQPEK